MFCNSTRRHSRLQQQNALHIDLSLERHLCLPLGEQWSEWTRFLFFFFSLILMSTYAKRKLIIYKYVFVLPHSANDVSVWYLLLIFFPTYLLLLSFVDFFIFIFLFDVYFILDGNVLIQLFLALHITQTVIGTGFLYNINVQCAFTLQRLSIVYPEVVSFSLFNVSISRPLVLTSAL